MEYITIIIFAVFVNNVILSQFLGICPFLGVSTKVSTAAGMGAAVVFVMTLSTIVTFLLQKFVLVPFGIEFLQTIVFSTKVSRLQPHHRAEISFGIFCSRILGARFEQAIAKLDICLQKRRYFIRFPLNQTQLRFIRLLG